MTDSCYTRASHNKRLLVVVMPGMLCLQRGRPSALGYSSVSSGAQTPRPVSSHTHSFDVP